MNENAKTKLVLEYTGMDDFPVRYIRTNSESCGRILTLAKSLNRIFILYLLTILMENLPIPYSRSTHFIRLRIKEVPMNSSTGC